MESVVVIDFETTGHSPHLGERATEIAAVRVHEGRLVGCDQSMPRAWTIETLFAALKTNGFHLEETHLTQPEGLESLLGLLTLASVWALHAGLWLHAQQSIREKNCGADSSASSATSSTCSSVWPPSVNRSARTCLACWAVSSLGSPWAPSRRRR